MNRPLHRLAKLAGFHGMRPSVSVPFDPFGRNFRRNANLQLIVTAPVGRKAIRTKELHHRIVRDPLASHDTRGRLLRKCDVPNVGAKQIRH
jgi:hypothetical protein